MDIITYAKSKSYTDETWEGGGIAAGKNCTIDSITNITGGHRVTFKWTLDNGTEKTSTMDVMDGEDGLSVASAAINPSNNHLILTMTDGTTKDCGEVPTVQGEQGEDGKSAYEIAVEHGYSGTEEEWLASLKGDKGDAGEGVPTGGTTGQVLVKKSSEDYDTEWGTPAGGGDMLKSVYDTDNDGKVDSAENADTVGGHTVAKDVPADAKFTDTVYDDTEIRGDIADKVDKVTGKGLSTNDYSDADKAIVDGVTSALAGKADVADLPSKTSDLTNDSGFITKAVNDLVNYYLKSETYSKTEVDDIVTAIKNSRFEVVATLPTTDIKTNVIYLVPKSPSQTSNVKDEYINLDGTSAGWEKIGDTEIDLSDYVTTQALNTALAAYTTTSDLTTLLAGKQDTLTFDNVPTENSNNPVKSGGIYTAEHSLAEKIDKVGNVSGDAEIIAYTDIVSIEDALAVNVKDVSIKIEPVQAGSGTPSPDNQRDISGWSSVDITRCGKNLLDPQANTKGVWTQYGVTFTPLADGSFLVNSDGAATGQARYYFASDMVFKEDVIFSVEGAQSGKVQAWCNGTMANSPLTINANDTLDTTFLFVNTGDTVTNVIVKPMIRLASDTDTTYEPYQGNEYTIDLGGTIYGGTLDVTSGKLTVTHGFKELNGSEGITWNITTSEQDIRQVLYANITNNLPNVKTSGREQNSIIFNMFVNKTTSAWNIGEAVIDSNNGAWLNMVFSPHTFADSAEFNTWLASNHVQFTYELATPQVIQLTPIQIRMLAGVNTVYANAGDTQVEYFNASVGNLGEVVGDVQEDTQTLTNQVKDMNNVLGAKNLLPNQALNDTWKGITWKVNNDGTLSASGTATENSIRTIVEAFEIPVGRYILNGCPSGSGYSTYYLNFSVESGTVTPNGGNDIGEGLVFEVTQTAKITVKARVISGQTVNIAFKPMIRLASITDDTYEPYAKTNQQLTAENQTLMNNVDVLFETGVKNICPPYSGSFSSNGITYIGNSDGTVTANGTCSANVGTNIRVYLKAGQYKVSGCPSGGSYSTYRIGVTTDSWTLIGTHDFGNGTTITIPSDGYYRINLDVREGYVANNLVFKPMITDVDTPESDYDHYVPYAKTNRQLMEDSVDWRSNSVLGAKNFLTNKGTATTQGVEFVVDSNGVFTVTRKSAGSSHAYYSNGTFDLPAGTYIFSNGYDTLPSGIQATYLYNRTDSAYFINCNNGPKMFTLTSAKTLAFNIEVQTTQSPSGVKIYPMIRLASDNDATYQPYAKTNRELTEAVDGMMMKVGRYTKTVKGTNTTYGALIDQICADMKTLIDGFADTNTKVIPMSITIDGLVTLLVRSDQYKKGDNFNIVAYCTSCDGTTFNTFYLRGLSGSGNSTIYRQDVTASSQAINDLTSTSFTGDKNISLIYDRYQII